MATGAVTKMFLQKSTLQNASNILQSLPKNITEQFNEEEKNNLLQIKKILIDMIL